MQAMERRNFLRAVLFCEKGAFVGLCCIFALRWNKHCATLCLSDGRLMGMLISTKGRYALRVMIDLAEQDRDGYHVLMDIAKRQEISEKYLESIIAILSKAGFVQAQRGRGGGYRLSREPQSYTVGSILKLTEGPLAPVACLEDGENTCSRAAQCKTLPIWMGLDELMQNYLESITLADLLEQPEQNRGNSEA